MLAVGRATGDEQLAQVRDVRRFHDVMVEAGGMRAALIMCLPPAGDGDELHVAEHRCGTNAPRHFVPVHIRHPDIQQHRIRKELFERMQRVASAMRNTDLRT